MKESGQTGRSKTPQKASGKAGPKASKAATAKSGQGASPGAGEASSGAKPGKAAAGSKGRSAKRSVLPGPEIKRAAKKAAKKATTQEKLATVEQQPSKTGKPPARWNPGP